MRVVFDPAVVTYQQLLKVFRESHDPTQGFRQGHDVGTQYRSPICPYTPAQLEAALASRDLYPSQLKRPASARSQPTSVRRPSSPSPTPTTSNAWSRSPTAIAPTMAPVSPARSGWESRRTERRGFSAVHLAVGASTRWYTRRT